MPSHDKNNQYKRVTAVCPHYRSSTSQLIRCGDIPDVALIQIAFGSRTLRKEHEDRYCCDRYERCPFMKLR